MTDITKVCEACGKEYESSKFQPYIVLCKPCRKKAKKAGKAVIKPTPKKVVIKVDPVADDLKDKLKEDRLKNYMVRAKILEYLRLYKKIGMGFNTYILEAEDLAGKEWKQRIVELKHEGYNIVEKSDGLHLLDPEKKTDANKTAV